MGCGYKPNNTDDNKTAEKEKESDPICMNKKKQTVHKTRLLFLEDEPVDHYNAPTKP